MDTTASGKIGKYEIIGTLGRGGMGEVILARDNLGRKVAIKRPFPNALVDGLARFQVEAKAATLEHPNIPAVYELGEQDGLPFIAMEFVEGDPLEKIIKSGKPLDLILKLSIIEQVCLALGYAHEKGIIHRDIKPANVIVRPDGVAKIIDFGIAKIQNLDGNTRLTQPSQLIGTLHYLAPERLKGQTVDGRADIFSAGVMLYLLLTGHLPFGGGEETAPYKIVNEAPTSLAEHLREYPPGLDAILELALAKNPNDRYSSAEDFADALHEIIEELTRTRSVQLFDDAERLATERRFEPALELLQEVIKLDPNNTQARKLRKLVRDKLADKLRKERLVSLISRADEYIAAANYPEAISELKKAEEIDPTAPEVRERIDFVEGRMRRQERSLGALAEAEAAKQRGDLTAALRILSKAQADDPENSDVQTAQSVLARQINYEEQQGKIHGIIESARRELLKRNFEAAQKFLSEAESIDAAHPDIDKLQRELVRTRQHEERLLFLDQTRKSIDEYLKASDFASATDLIVRGLERFPNEMLLNRWKAEVEAEERNADVRRFIDSAIARSKELFATSPTEAIAAIDAALEQMPGEERLSTFRRSLQQRIDAHRAEQLLASTVNNAQELLAANQFDKAVGVLESFQLEFGNYSEIDELLLYAQDQRAKRQRSALVERCTGEARAMVREERLDDAIRVLEYGIRETNDTSLSRLLEEVREQQVTIVRKLEVLQKRVTLLRDRGELDEAIGLLQEYLATTPDSPRVLELQKALQGERERKQLIQHAIQSADEAAQRQDYSAAIESLQAVQRAYGESTELTSRIEKLQANRASHAREVVGQSLETARTAVAKNDAQGALAAIKSSAALVEFADATQQADWKRIGQVANEAVRKPDAAISLDDLDKSLDRRRGVPVWLVAAIVVVVLAVGGFIAWKVSTSHVPPPPVVGQTRLRVTSVPKGAVISVDKGTPQTGSDSGVLTFDVKSKKPEIEFSQTGFTSTTYTVDVDEGQTTAFVLPTPMAASQSAMLKLSGNLDEFAVSVDGVNLGQKHKGEKIPVKVGGIRTIVYSAKGYGEAVHKVAIADNKDREDPFELKPLALPAANLGNLVIHTLPGAAVKLDGIDKGRADQVTGAMEIKDLSQAQHHVDISLDGYTPITNAAIGIVAGKINDFDGKLAALPPTGTLEADHSSITSGDKVKLSWQVNHATSVRIEGDGVTGSSFADLNGITDAYPTKTGQVQYKLYANNAGGSVLLKSVDVTIAAKPAPSTPVDSHPTVDATPKPPAAADTTAADKQGIQEALQSFQAAYNSGKMDKVDKAWRSHASDYPQLGSVLSVSKVVEKCSPNTLAIHGSEAEWDCTESLTVDGDKKRPADVTLKFVKSGDTWIVDHKSKR